ncbi:M28 family peptidase [Fodinibius sediminis]|uniref:Peptidase family M28 n=1 Tax=Fodinibius sediminis TaxID=1214077 RepID=A0A521F2P8_9BACT|nr:M28 family peptidase [Fodinibius sediminis]SMO90462.1 Peptidase family M28 [Fodinibius sediminis]
MENNRLLHHIEEIAQCPSFSSYEERLHPYVRSVFEKIQQSREEKGVAGNSLMFRVGHRPERPTIALAAHLDKINHYGSDFPDSLPVTITEEYIEGAMDDSVGVGLLLRIAEEAANHDWPDLLFFFSEMEESKGLREQPELLKDGGKGCEHGMGARRIVNRCLNVSWLPDLVITLDTTPIFKGEPGIALYARHWELNNLDASDILIKATEEVINAMLKLNGGIRLHNNTNDYLHYGYEFNKRTSQDIVSIALEPAIHPYHQRGERVYTSDVEEVFDLTVSYLNSRGIA